MVSERAVGIPPRLPPTIEMLASLVFLSITTPSAFFRIQVVDADTGRGVPLVELRTVNHLLYITDSNGLVALDEPGLMGEKVFFHVRSEGYEMPVDGFGYRGVALDVRRKGSAKIRIKRLNIAERLCRLTGEGIYRDSILLGEKAPVHQPVLNGQVLGQDSAQAVVHRGRMLWFWGDTDRLSYPLGNFRTTGAVASYPVGRKDASLGIQFDYFKAKDGFVREMVPSIEEGPIWISGLVNYVEKGRETLWTYYSRMKSLGEKLEHGFARWNDKSEKFEIVSRLRESDSWRHLDGHPVRFEEGGKRYVGGGFCFPTVRVADEEALVADPEAYEAFACVDEGGSLAHRWQRRTPPTTPEAEKKLVEEGKLPREKARFLPVDAAGETILPHGGSVAWNPWRRRWIAFFTRMGGKDSLLGEIYYSEADDPLGPWRRAVKVITHDRYTFYNPVHHPFLDTDGGRTVYFEGTYTAQFSGNEVRTPRYDYNQILYRLDLSDPRLAFVQ